MKSKVTNLLEIEKIQVDLKEQNMDLRKNQGPEKMKNQLIKCSTCGKLCECNSHWNGSNT